jgi:hypothetical protein
LLFFYRKNPSIILERQLNSNSLVYSPVNGIIDNIEGSTIYIKTSILEESGVYAPFKCETKEFSRGNQAQILIANDNENEIRLSFIKGILPVKPRFWLENKDRAKCGAVIGFKPFGGLMQVDLQGDASIISKIGNKVEASQTIIAKFKDQYDK